MDRKWKRDVTKCHMKLEQILLDDSPKMTASHFVPHQYTLAENSSSENLEY